jgi:prepilin-type N-terminal cleavage/methylation domain-containing protein
MNLYRLTPRPPRGLSLIELLVVIAIIAAFFSILVPMRAAAHARATRRHCINNLKETGVAWMLWDADHCGEFPMSVPATNGGTMEFTSGPGAFRHFQVMSNELGNPKFAFCPAETDRNRFVVNNFAQFGNSNLSYFVAAVPHECTPTMILSGDRNITNGMRLKNAVLGLTPNQPGGWTDELHKEAGNILKADGGVEQVNTAGLRNLIAAQQTANTNLDLAETRLQMPVLGQ